MPPANADSIVAFDVGLKRTGVAVGSRATGTAQPEATLAANRGQLDWQAMDQLLQRWQPKTCVVGDPNTEDPHLNKLIRRLIQQLESRKIRVVRVDEHLTSEKANTLMAERGFTTAQKSNLRDQSAACLILESYLAQTTE